MWSKQLLGTSQRKRKNKKKKLITYGVYGEISKSSRADELGQAYVTQTQKNRSPKVTGELLVSKDENKEDPSSMELPTTTTIYSFLVH